MGIFGLISTIIVGLIVGALAILGGLISSLIWRSPGGGFHPAGWIMSIVGAVIILYGYLHWFH